MRLAFELLNWVDETYLYPCGLLSPSPLKASIEQKCRCLINLFSLLVSEDVNLLYFIRASDPWSIGLCYLKYLPSIIRPLTPVPRPLDLLVVRPEDFEI